MLACVLILCFIVTASADEYLLTDEERSITEEAVMAEASTDFYGQALIAECLKNASILNGWTISETLENYGWTYNRITPSISASWAVKAVFDYNYSPSDGQLPTIFYNPDMAGNSDYHEGQTFVAEWKSVRFFREQRFETLDEETSEWKPINLKWITEVAKMNNARRAKIEAYIKELEEMESKIDSLKDEEEEAYDNLPDGIRDSERGANIDDAIQNLDSAIIALEEAIEDLGLAKN